ncbi:fumarylacetoacetate hydrolase family protein [Edaphobacter dinghuensis]|uniref:2-hydroxyhepta-2,4-diene-1,7-dioate isomerase n=1 Tax=Edaphobacter dinghuensis TaxID=1560005 RepID=A0A917H6J2_9BACT|nr:fumarylacetoacetate hydrolase family protein [Edaphobacter dinghuensis]GGG69020.1 2-hydroxyhepta-2,4-diene-1,7-dioate isomerase [Edaphobacter dinghuensis]
MRLYRTQQGPYLLNDNLYYRIEDTSWDALITREDLHAFCRSVIERGERTKAFSYGTLLAPIESQEVWAAGVTYYRSRSARIEESKDAGGGDFYDRVYSATRPELFFKATGARVVAPNHKVRVRSDATWSVPEPELTLLISPKGTILGYTIGNDMSSRDIEGENPLYLPQAKVYDGSCALGPCIFVDPEPLPTATRIAIQIVRNGETAFSGSTALSELKRDPKTLVSFLYRDNSFPKGCFLMTGTGIVPPDSFTLASGDQIRIVIDPIGTLVNEVA